MAEYPPLIVYDENDKPIDKASLDEIHKKGLLHRSVIVAVLDQNRRILLQRRGHNVATNPNRWDISAAGHVDEGEDYKEAAERELFEELGLSGFKLTEIAYYKTYSEVDGRKLNRFIRVYKTSIPSDTKILINPEEINEIEWIDIEELENEIERRPSKFNHDFEEVLDKIRDKL